MEGARLRQRTVLVRGATDVGSTVAHRLFTIGHRVVLHDDPQPTVSRRTMAFTDAIFDGRCELAGVAAVRVDAVEEVMPAATRRAWIPVVVSLDLAGLLAALAPEVMIDARMRKREHPGRQRGLAPLTIGLGPNFTAGDTVDVVIETAWDDLGRIIDTGPARPLAGEPRSLAGHGRERFVYASVAGVLRSAARIGQPVAAGDVVAVIGSTPVVAPIPGSIRALTRDCVLVAAGTKVLEIDPRGDGAVVTIGERPRRIADSVLEVVKRWTGTCRRPRTAAVRSPP